METDIRSAATGTAQAVYVLLPPERRVPVLEIQQMGALIERVAVVSPPNARLGDESPVVALERSER